MSSASKDYLSGYWLYYYRLYSKVGCLKIPCIIKKVRIIGNDFKGKNNSTSKVIFKAIIVVLEIFHLEFLHQKYLYLKKLRIFFYFIRKPLFFFSGSQLYCFLLATDFAIICLSIIDINFKAFAFVANLGFANPGMGYKV